MWIGEMKLSVLPNEQNVKVEGMQIVIKLTAYSLEEA